MNEIINRCQFIGRFGKDPELQYLPSGTAVCNFSIAVDMTKKSGEEYTTEATWVDATAFGKTAETIVRLGKKGALIAIECIYGKRQYETRDGEKRTSHDFNVQAFRFLHGARTKEEQAAAPASSGKNGKSETYAAEDEFPF